VEKELKQAEKAGSSAIARYFPGATVDVRHLEIGRDQIDKDYEQSSAAILVCEERAFEIPGGFSGGG